MANAGEDLLDVLEEVVDNNDNDSAKQVLETFQTICSRNFKSFQNCS